MVLGDNYVTLSNSPFPAGSIASTIFFAMSRRFSLADLLLWLTFISLVLALVVQIYRWRSGSALSRLVVAVAVSDDASTIAALRADGTVYVWDSETAAPKAVFTVQSGLMGHIALSPDGKTIAVSGGVARSRLSKDVQIWDVTKRQLASRIASQMGCRPFFSPDGRWLAIWPKDQARLTLYALTLDRGPQAVRTVEQCHAAAFSPDGEKIAIMQADAQLRVYDLATGALQSTFPSDAQGDNLQLRWSPDGETLVARQTPARGKQKTVRLIETWSLSAPGGKHRSVKTDAALDAPLGDGDFTFLRSGKLLLLPGIAKPIVLDTATLEPIAASQISKIPMAMHVAAGGRGEFFVAASVARLAVHDATTFERRLQLLQPSRRPNLVPVLCGLAVWVVVFSARRARHQSIRAADQSLTPEAQSKPRQIEVSGYFISCIIGLCLTLAIMSRNRPGPLQTISFTVVAIAFAVLAFIAFVYGRFRWRLARLSKPANDIALANKAADAEGTARESGQMLVWAAPGTSLSEILEEEIETARERLAAAIGRGTPPPTARAFFFDDNEAAVRYLMHYGLRLDPRFSGKSFYLRAPVRRIVIVERCLREQAAEPRKTLRTFAVYHLLELIDGKTPAAWIDQGLGAALARDDEDHELDRLHRRIAAARAAGRGIPAAEFFTNTSNRIWRKHAQCPQLDHFAWSNQFWAQSWSVIEYLCGRGSTPERRLAFQKFFDDADRRKRPARAIQRHFVCTFDELLAGWQAWADGQVTDEHHPPPERLAAYLTAGPIAKIASPETSPSERVIAIRELGEHGYLLGADRLIDLLHGANEEIRAEAVWALECISGKVLGWSATSWQAWWQSVSEQGAASAVSS